MRTMFGRLGFTGQGPVMLTVDQGIGHIDELKSLDADEIETLLNLCVVQAGRLSIPTLPIQGNHPSSVHSYFQ